MGTAEEKAQMSRLATPDLCCHIDRLKILCNRLQKAQRDRVRYRGLLRQIRVEMNAMHTAIGRCQPARLA